MQNVIILFRSEPNALEAFFFIGYASVFFGIITEWLKREAQPPGNSKWS